MDVLLKMGTSLIFVFIYSSLTFFTVIAQNHLSSPIQDANCMLPPYPEHGRYTVSNYPAAKPGESYPSVKLDVSCDNGYFNKNTTNSIFCVNGEWSASIPICARFCNLTNDLSIEYRCELSGNLLGSQKCESLVPAGTIVTPICRSPMYFFPGVLPKMHCIDGVWDYIPICKPECGIMSPATSSLLTSNDRVGLPWNVAIYNKMQDSAFYLQICSGSLISTNKIISAAHCFWNEVRRLLNPAEQYAVAAGKLYRPYNEPRDINSQKSNLVDIKIPPRFQGAATNFQDDIAIVVVETPFIYHLSVRPVCLDFDQNFEKNQLKDGNTGKAPSWNFGVMKRQSSLMSILDLPYLNIEDCFKISPPDFRQLLTNDKFCVGSDNGKFLCRGDSGGGLAFPSYTRNIERYYLRGVLSVSPTNEDACGTFNTFTSIVKHEDFIKQYL